MRGHKAPTAVTIAPTEERSGFAEWVDKYWKIAAIVALAITAWILYRAQSHQTIVAESQAEWSKVLAVAKEDPSSGILRGTPGEMERIGEDLRDSPAGGWALYIGATSALEEQDYDRAEALLERLRQEHPGHLLVTEAVPGPDGSASMPIVDHIQERIASTKAFVAGHPSLFQNPPLPADAPRVRIETEAGSIVVGLYSDLAPGLATNFLKLCTNGYYKGTKFHGVVGGEFIQGGDPNTIAGEVETWGRGGTEETFAFEPTELKHFAGVLSAVPAPAEPGRLSGCQFLITVRESHSFDPSYAPFGQVLEGLDVVERISNSPIAEGSFNRPQIPVAITGTEVLE